ncbi:MAG: oligosaccharide flippase family protein [Pyrinomonadaceae bacterium]
MAEKTPVKLSLLKQSAWLMSAKTIGFALSFILPLLTVRYLTQDKVGVYRQAFQIVTNAVSILPLGFSMSAYYFLNRQPEKRAYTISNILIFNFIAGGAACLTFFFFPQLLGNLFNSDEMTALAPKIGVVIWLWIFSMFLEIVALANQESKIATAFIILAQLTKTLLMASAVIWFSTVEAFLYAAMIQAALQICVLLYYLNSRFPRFWTKFDFTFFREQIIYALPFGLAALLYNFQTDIHVYFVGNHFSDAEFAVYSIGCFQLPLIAMLYESFSAVMIPQMSEMQAQGKMREMLLISVAATRKLALAYFPLFAFLMIVADTFITTMFTEKFAASVPIFRINLVLLPFYCLMIDPIGRAFPSIGRFLLKLRLLLFIVLFAALWFGIQNFDMRGMISIVVVVVLFEQMISLIKVLSILKVRRGDLALLAPIGKTALAATIAGAVLFAFYTLSENFLAAVCLRFSHNLFALIRFEKAADFFGGSLFLGICFVIFVSVYFVSASWLGAINSEEKESIKSFFYNRFPFLGNYFIQSPKSEI